MKTEINNNGNVTIIKIEGRLDTVTSTEFDRQMNAFGAIDKDMTLDCESMEYISSAGLRSLITLLKKVKAEGHQLTVEKLQPAVRQVFDMTGFTTLFKID